LQRVGCKGEIPILVYVRTDNLVCTVRCFKSQTGRGEVRGRVKRDVHLDAVDSEELIPLHIVLQSVVVVRFAYGDAPTVNARIFGADK